MKRLVAFFMILVCFCANAQIRVTPWTTTTNPVTALSALGGAGSVLQAPINGNGFSITNLSGIVSANIIATNTVTAIGGIITNNGLVWIVTNNILNTGYPDGSIASRADTGLFYTLSGGVWSTPGGGGGITLAQLQSSTNNALFLSTNNDILVSQNATNQGTVVSNGVIASLGSAAFTASSAYDVVGSALAATNGLAQVTTNRIQGYILAATNTVGADLRQERSDSTNQLAIATTNRIQGYILAATNTVGTDLRQERLDSTNQLAISATNHWDPLNSALNATNTANLAVNLAGSFDALNAAQNATNTARLAVNLAGSFDVLNAALNATNGLVAANIWDSTNTALNSTNGLNKLIWPGYTWKITATPTPLFTSGGVTYGNGIFVYPAEDSSIAQFAYSTDGLNWISNSLPHASSWRSGIYANGQFVYVGGTAGAGNDVMTSPDGLHWTVRTASSDLSWEGIAYGNGLYVAVAPSGPSSGATMTSKDGVTWSAGSTLTGIMHRVCFGNQLFVIVGDSHAYTSPDGITWTSQTVPANFSPSAICYGNSLYVAIASSSGSTATSVFSSPDGTNWVAQTSAIAGPVSIAFGSGIFAAAKGTGAMASFNGTNWVSVTFSTPQDPLFMTYGNGIFCAVTGPNSATSGHLQQSIPANGNIMQGGLITYGGVTNANLTSADATGTDSNGKQIQSTAISMSHITQPGIIVTNGETQAITVSNTFGADAAHFMNGPMSPSVLTNGASGGSRLQFADSNKKIIDAAASGAVPVDADGSATTFAQVQALAPGEIVTNGNTTAITLSNNVAVDATHTFFASDTTNNVRWLAANATLNANDTFVLLTGAHTATMPSPSAQGVSGKLFYIQCSSAGTNGILQNASETFNGPFGTGLTKITNSSVGKGTALYSNGTNWYGFQF